MVHIYIGEGKGKTTASLGLALRACGWEKSVYIAQFLKDKKLKAGEIEAVKKTRVKIKIERFKNQVHPLFLDKSKFNKKSLVFSLRLALKKIKGYIKNKKYQLIILDEVLNALSDKFITVEDLLELINISEGVELVFTGRACPKSLFKKADYISYIKEVKHPFRKGIKAREGIEY